jgi:Ca2+/Na+ antiporter
MNLEEQRTSCPGFLDEYGIWNNGFDCPSVSNQIRVCCGSDSRRYCCTFKQISPRKLSSSINETILSFLKKINLTFLTLPIQLTFILLLILLFLLIFLIVFLCYRYHKRKNNSFKQEQLSTKQTIITNHFPFSPPNHRLIFNENNNPQIKDILITSAARLPSDIYLNDWKECFQPTEQQSMNIYPTISSHNYQKHQQNEIIV